MPTFQVRLLPSGEYRKVDAASAKEAAEKEYGAELTDHGRLARTPCHGTSADMASRQSTSILCARLPVEFRVFHPENYLVCLGYDPVRSKAGAVLFVPSLPGFSS